MASKKRRAAAAARKRRRLGGKHRYPNLAAYILATKRSQQDVADAVGISQAHLSRILQGLRAPRPALARRLAAYCSIPIESFTVDYLGRAS